jgi:hypothetical protein
VGADRRASDRARPSSFRLALCHGLRITGDTFWYLSNGVSKEFFEALLETFAREAEAGAARIILLVLDNAGWHGPANLKIPEGIRLIYLPPYSPDCAMCQASFMPPFPLPRIGFQSVPAEAWLSPLPFPFSGRVLLRTNQQI